jgi:hypothetical protein
MDFKLTQRIVGKARKNKIAAWEMTLTFPLNLCVGSFQWVLKNSRMFAKNLVNLNQMFEENWTQTKRQTQLFSSVIPSIVFFKLLPNGKVSTNWIRCTPIHIRQLLLAKFSPCEFLRVFIPSLEPSTICHFQWRLSFWSVYADVHVGGLFSLAKVWI